MPHGILRPQSVINTLDRDTTITYALEKKSGLPATKAFSFPEKFVLHLIPAEYKKTKAALV